ncbi:hypothetical protein KR059_004884, partial [Drosophila kikkawai]
HPFRRLLCGPTGHPLAGRLPHPAAMHLPLDRSSLPTRWLHLALPHPHRYEDGRQANGQAGAPDAKDW